jgi:hypothetical protein
MESIFQYSSFEESEEEEEAIDKIEEEITKFVRTTKSVVSFPIKMVRNASTMALNTLKPKNNPNSGIISKTYSAAYKTTSFVGHQLGTVSNGLVALLNLSKDSTLNYSAKFAIEYLRNTLDFKHHSLDLVRLGLDTSSVLQATQIGVQLQQVSFTVSQNAIYKLELHGEAYLRNSHAWGYPMPKDHQSSNLIKGEWVIPDDNLEKTKKQKLFGKFFKGEETPRKVIYYLHGGAYVVGNYKIFRNLTALLAKNSDCPVFAIDYRLAPGIKLLPRISVSVCVT